MAKRSRKKRKRKRLFLTQANGRERGLPGMGLGAHQQVSPMARSTQTPSKVLKQRRQDRKAKQRGWQN